VDGVRVEVDSASLRLLVVALGKEADGKALVRDLVKELRAVAEPARDAARASVLGMESTSAVLPGLRAAVARNTRVTVRTTGSRAGVGVRASKSGMPRGFRNAPRRLNAYKGWRHPVFGDRSVWVVQRGRPGWFDDSIEPFKPAAAKGAAAALDSSARRISRRTRG
jgi:hypothetical protein